VQPLECAGHGKCTLAFDANLTALCDCNKGFKFVPPTCRRLSPSVLWLQIGAGVGGFLAVYTLLSAMDSGRCRRRLSRCCCCCCGCASNCRRSRRTSDSGLYDDVFAASNRGHNGSIDSTHSFLEPQRTSSTRMAPFALTSIASVDGSIDTDVHPTRYRSFIAVLLCLLRLVFTFGVPTYTYALHSLRRRLLWLQLTSIGVGILIGLVTTLRFFASLKETYTVLHKGQRRALFESRDVGDRHGRRGSAASELWSAVPTAINSDSVGVGLATSLAVAPSYEAWSRRTLYATSLVRMLSVFKPAVLEVLVSRACGAAAFSMPVTEVFGGWRYVEAQCRLCSVLGERRVVSLLANHCLSRVVAGWCALGTASCRWSPMAVNSRSCSCPIATSISRYRTGSSR
jgi:hypothetical protein